MSRATLRERLSAEARRVHGDEEGSTIVFAAITLFTLALSILFVFQMSLVSADRLQIQAAADAAAYSGAQVEANSLNSIGQINDGIAYVNYIMLRYMVDSVVYVATLQQYEMWTTPATGQYGYVLMGEREGRARVKHIDDLMNKRFGNNRRLFEAAAYWLGDLHSAARIVMASTPQLVEKTALAVAGTNGATHLAISEDVRQAFRVGDSAGMGFTENAYTSDRNAFTPALYKRYEQVGVPQIVQASSNRSQTEKQELPGAGWFDKRTGRVTGEYSQVRVCWNQNDWDHFGNSGGSPHVGSPYAQFGMNSPNAHWHRDHPHYDLSSGFPVQIAYHDIGHRNDDPVHNQAQDFDAQNPHHKVEKCPTCMNYQGANPRPNGGRSLYAEVKASSRRQQQFINGLNSFFRQLPKHSLALTEDALRSGVTVIAYRPGQGLGNIFPKSPWGMMAVATAQVGYQTDQGVLGLKSAQRGTATYDNGDGASDTVPYWTQNASDPEHRNLFYDPQPSNQQRSGFGGVRFGARLVPISRELSWNSQNTGTGLDQTLRRFRATPNSGGAQAPNREAAALKAFVRADSQQALEAFWH